MQCVCFFVRVIYSSDYGIEGTITNQTLLYLIFVIMSFEVSLLYNQDTLGGPICLSEFPFSSPLYAMWFIFFIFSVDMWFIFNLMYLLQVLFFCINAFFGFRLSEAEVCFCNFILL